MITPNVSGAQTTSGKEFLQAATATGRWAGEQMLRAMQENRKLSAADLRSLDTLRKDEWVAFDEALVEEAEIRLRGIADLQNAGLTIPVANALGKTVFEYEKVSDMEPAVVSLDGLARSDNDRVEFDLNRLPLPITHKDFNISIRTLTASRERGESLDTTQVRVAGRLVAEELERMLFQGGRTFVGFPIFGYTSHPDRNTGTFGTGPWSAGATTGEEILDDVLTMMGVLEADRMFGPYWLYVPGNTSVKLEGDFKANSDKTIRQRLLEIDGLSAIRAVDQLPADNIILVQATRDVVALVDGEGIQSVQWDIYGGFSVAFKAFAIQVPLIRADIEGRSGVFHMS